jgi:RNA recognition motif-containing protein
MAFMTEKVETKLYLGNLPWETTTDSLSDFLLDLGLDFHSAKVITDRESGRSRGFAFIEFSSHEQYRSAKEQLAGYVYGGRRLIASEAKERAGKSS